MAFTGSAVCNRAHADTYFQYCGGVLRQDNYNRMMIESLQKTYPNYTNQRPHGCEDGWMGCMGHLTFHENATNVMYPNTILEEMVVAATSGSGLGIMYSTTRQSPHGETTMQANTIGNHKQTKRTKCNNTINLRGEVCMYDCHIYIYI